MQYLLKATTATASPYRIKMTQSSGDQNERSREVAAMRPEGSPADQFAPLASVFRRRFLTGIGTASLVAVGANFGGITSFLFGVSPESARSLKLDVLYPIGGYSRCLEANEGFEFLYPSNWVGDQTLLYRIAEKVEKSLDPPALNSGEKRRRNVNEPVVAFGPPGSSGELNVSVIVSPVPIDFSIEAFAGAKEVGEAIVKTITSSTSKRPQVKGTLIQSNIREDSLMNVKYYILEFQVEGSSFQRHNVAVCCARRGRLYTLNAQAPQSLWPMVKSDLYRIADSFVLTS